MIFLVVSIAVSDRVEFKMEKQSKLCGCGRLYELQEWEKLHYVGDMDDTVEVLEMRNCVCGSTIAIVIGTSRKVPKKLCEAHLCQRK